MGGLGAFIVTFEALQISKHVDGKREKVRIVYILGNSQALLDRRASFRVVAQRERSKDPIGFLVGSLIDTLHRAA